MRKEKKTEKRKTVTARYRSTDWF